MSGSNGPSQPRAKPRTTVRGQSYALEVGAFEGRSTVWLLENILTHPASTLTYVDTFAGGAEHASQDLTDLESRFRANTEPHRSKLVAKKGPSAMMLRDLTLAFADTSLELTRYSTLKTDANRRLIHAQSRRPEVPARLAYEWNAATGEFRVVADPRERQFVENWQTVLSVLKSRAEPFTHKELREHWPSDVDRPGETTLYDWLNLAYTRKLIRREGKGTRLNPWRYRLENADDAYWDRGELPPIRLR